MAARPVPSTPAVPTEGAPRRSPGRVPPTLREVLDQLDRVLAPLGWHEGPMAVGVEPSGDLSVMVPPGGLDGDPVAAFVGRDAEPGWSAYGIVATGRVHDLAEEGGRAHGRRRPVEQRARMGHLVDRSGASVSYLHLEGEEARHREDASGGRLDDVCRRALGLPTPPPAVAVDVLWATWWLEDLLVAAREGGVTTWADAAARHLATRPAARPIVGVLPDDPDPVQLAVAAHRLAAEWPWDDLRRLVATGGLTTLPQVAPEAAAWMDAGMFSRWALVDEPPLSMLLDACSGLLPGPVVGAIGDALRAGGLP